MTSVAAESLRLSGDTRDRLRCPICRSGLQRTDHQLTCRAAGCGVSFPIVHGIPVLIHEQQSVYSIQDIQSRPSPFFRPRSRAKRIVLALVPGLGRNRTGVQNSRRLLALLFERTPRPRVLTIGGGHLATGMELLANNPAVELVESDVHITPRTVLVCDAHDLPFEDGSFDAVTVGAVLEHVLDPVRCVEEIYRVLGANGLVYADTPFMQQVHGGCYDFTRFTELGHRRLFRRFETIESGINSGPGTALAWAYTYFLVSFAGSRIPRILLGLLARFTSFWLPYLDRYLNRKPGATDAASSFYFLGRKSPRTLPDRELIGLYRGLAS